LVLAYEHWNNFFCGGILGFISGNNAKLHNALNRRHCNGSGIIGNADKMGRISNGKKKKRLEQVQKNPRNAALEMEKKENAQKKA